MMKRPYTELIARLQDIVSDSRNARMWAIGGFRVADREYDLYRIAMAADPPGPIKVCISAGIHGDEPASAEAAARFLEENADNAELLRRFTFTIFPCDNPSGYELGTRENAAGIDLNREFHARKSADEAIILTQALEEERFDHIYELHEDVDSYGFYLYELAAESRLRTAPDVVRAVSAAGYPINLSECIEGREARCGVISPSVSRLRRGKLPKAVFAYRLGNPHVMTFETPGTSLPIEDRVAIQMMALRTALDRAGDDPKSRAGKGC